jgi:hypothetical protein
MEVLQGKLCKDCGFYMLEPSFLCPNCGSENLASYTFQGRGKVYTYTVVHVGFGHLASRTPYILAIVELAEGLKIITILEDLDIDKVEINQPVQFKRLEVGTGPIFMPA